MNDTEIHIILNADGTTKIDVIGAFGPSCTELSRPYVDLFTTTQEVKKNEYYEQRAAAKQQQGL